MSTGEGETSLVDLVQVLARAVDVLHVLVHQGTGRRSARVVEMRPQSTDRVLPHVRQQLIDARAE